VPRWRPAGSPFGRLRASRRGLGSSVAGSRPYRPGDSLASIDWKSSARLSSVRAEPEFLVREHFADEAPRVVVVADHRPSMRLYPGPWLSKPDALGTVWRIVSSTAVSELGLVGYLDAGAPTWVPPSGGQRVSEVGRHVAEAPYSGGSLDDAFVHLEGIRRSLPAGSFVFVCSDYLAPPDPAWWTRAVAHRWDVVPVILQDPVWEQSFPRVDGLVIPFADPESGRVRHVRLRRGEAEERRRTNEARLDALITELRQLGLEPIVIGSAAEPDVLQALTDWGETRLAVRRGEW
jgi:uncharacterized protein (DUF58 family)